jgi:hypothetical protein
MEPKRSSETSVYNKLTRRYIPGDGIIHSHRRENLKSYKYFVVKEIAIFLGRCLQLRKKHLEREYLSTPQKHYNVYVSGRG